MLIRVTFPKHLCTRDQARCFINITLLNLQASNKPWIPIPASWITSWFLKFSSTPAFALARDVGSTWDESLRWRIASRLVTRAQADKPGKADTESESTYTWWSPWDGVVSPSHIPLGHGWSPFTCRVMGISWGRIIYLNHQVHKSDFSYHEKYILYPFL